MPRRNRVDPYGDIVAVPARGMFMGNRGILHDAEGRLGTSRWKLRAWLICRTCFRGRQRQVMSPNRYTELFFLDEATALAAGHRPCFECRRRDFVQFRDAWAAGNGWTGEHPPRVADMDGRLHRERIDARTRRQRTWRGRLEDLPDGTIVAEDGNPWLILGDRLLRWSHEGYGALKPRSARETTILTPPSTVAAIAAGFRPVLHPTARESAG